MIAVETMLAAAEGREAITTLPLCAPSRVQRPPGTRSPCGQGLPQIGIAKSRGHAASPISPQAFPSSSRPSQRKELSPAERPTQTPPQRGRLHLGIRGRLFLGTRGRHHFGIGGRLPSEFALVPADECRMALHRAGQADPERLRRELQRALRDECLNDTLFSTLSAARNAITSWKEDYNHHRPHSALGNMPPAEFAMKSTLEKQAA